MEILVALQTKMGLKNTRLNVYKCLQVVFTGIQKISNLLKWDQL